MGCWKLEFNPDPTKQANEVLFSCKKSIPNHPHIILNGTVVAKTNEQKHFVSYWIPSYLLKNTLMKKYIGIIKHLSCFLPLKTLDQMFKVLVRSHLNYCDIIYHIPSKPDQFDVTLNSLMEKSRNNSIPSCFCRYWRIARLKTFWRITLQRPQPTLEHMVLKAENSSSNDFYKKNSK